MNLYRYYNHPITLDNYQELGDVIIKVQNMLRWGRTVFEQDLDDVKYIIQKCPERAYRYAKLIMKRRWPEAEPYILKNATYSYYYAKEVMVKRWPEAESYIIKYPYRAVWYARDVIVGRWLESEHIIKTDEKIWKDYCLKFGVEND